MALPPTNPPGLVRDAEDLNKVINGDGTTNRAGDSLPSIKAVFERINDDFDAMQAGELTAQAVGAADRAETAAEVSASAGRLYESSGDGQADGELVDGDYFWVVSAEDSDMLELWRKGASSPTDTGKRTVSANYTDRAESNLINRFENSTSNLFSKNAYRDLAPPAQLGFQIDASTQTYVVNNALNQVTYKMPVKPDTDYWFIRADDSSAISSISVMGFDHLPMVGASGHNLTISTPSIIVEGGNIFKFTTNSSTKFIVYQHTIGNTGVTPLKIVEGSPFDVLSKQVSFLGNVVGDNIVRGKNLYDGKFVNAFIRDDGTFNIGTTGVSYYAPIEQGKTYTVTLVGNNRCSAFVTQSEPSSSAFGRNDRPYRRLRSLTDPLVHVFTFTAQENENFISVYVHSHVSQANVFMQLEEGDESTSLETPGYKFSKKAEPFLQESSSGFIEGAVGNANFILNDAAWVDAEGLIPATDDTAAIQEALDTRSIVRLDPSKKYLITEPLIVDTNKVRVFDGHMGMLVVNGDFPAIKLTGSLTANASPDTSGGLVFGGYGTNLTRIKVYPVTSGIGTGVELSGTFGAKIDKCDFTFLSKGISFINRNRNTMVWGNNIYASSDYGIYFAPNGDIHQVNIFGNHISYSKINIFGENHSIFNIQITGNDIETSSYPSDALYNIYFVQEDYWLECVEIVGNTIEDHGNTDCMIKLEGVGDRWVSSVTIASNVTGNSGGNILEIGGAIGVDISGRFKSSNGYTVVITDQVRGLKLNASTGQNSGGILYAVGDYELRDIKIHDCTASFTSANPVMIDVTTVLRIDVTSNTAYIRNLYDGDNSKGLIHIEADDVRFVRVEGNTLDTFNNHLHAVKVIGNTFEGKGMVINNLSGSGDFTAPSTFVISGNV